MLDFLDKEHISFEDINSLIKNNVEESINLDFKSGEALGHQEKKKSDIAKDVSAFANSAGGYIIYGIKELNHKATSLSPIDGDIYTKEWLEQIIQTRIQRRIEGLKIIPIRINGDLTNSIYIIKIPESSLAPHMTSDKRFYKRFNFESVQMEEYEIRNLLNKKEKTKLYIDNIFVSNNLNEEYESGNKIIYQKLYFQIFNASNAIEKYYKLFLILDFTDYSIKWDPLRNDKNVGHSISENEERIISFFGISPIFPHEYLTIGIIDFGLAESKKEKIINDNSFKLKLIYSNGIDEMEIKLKDFLMNKD